MIGDVGVGALAQQLLYAGGVAPLSGLVQRRLTHRVPLHRRLFFQLGGGPRRGDRNNAVGETFRGPGRASTLASRPTLLAHNTFSRPFPNSTNKKNWMSYLQTARKPTPTASVADQGCLSRIQILPFNLMRIRIHNTVVNKKGAAEARRENIPWE